MNRIESGSEKSSIWTSKMNAFTTASGHYINRLNSIERISTGSKNVDDILCGGIETRAVTEFYGAPSSGKTQLCHTICAIVSQDTTEGGVKGKSIFIDTEGTFRPQRVESIATARGFDPIMTLDSIIILEAHDTTQQEQIIENVKLLISKNTDNPNKFKLLVVDSPVTHYRSEYIGRSMLPMRQQKLFRFMRLLLKLAHVHDMAVVITNQINTTPNSRAIYSDRPIGGNAVNHAVTYGVRLSTSNGLIRHAMILISPYHPQKDAIFYIREKGVEDD
jgi:DNA repair protein RadA